VVVLIRGWFWYADSAEPAATPSAPVHATPDAKAYREVETEISAITRRSSELKAWLPRVLSAVASQLAATDGTASSRASAVADAIRTGPMPRIDRFVQSTNDSLIRIGAFASVYPTERDRLAPFVATAHGLADRVVELRASLASLEATLTAPALTERDLAGARQQLAAILERFTHA
jgi:hypothetical protein